MGAIRSTSGESQQQAQQRGYTSSARYTGTGVGNDITAPLPALAALDFGGGDTGALAQDSAAQAAAINVDNGSTTTGPQTYVVQPGDNISDILGTSDPTAIGAVLRANGLTNSTIHPGRTLILPDSSGAGDAALGQAALNTDNTRLAEIAAQREQVAAAEKVTTSASAGAAGEVPFYLSQSSAGVDVPSSFASSTGSGLITANDSFVRVAYRAAAQSASEEALQVIDQLGRGDIPGVAAASEAAFDARNSIRVDAQSQLSPGGAANSQAIEPERTFESQFKKYTVLAEDGSVDEFATYRAIASAAGRTNSVVNGFSVAGKIGGPLLTAAGIGSSIYNVVEATPNARAEVASEEVGANLGGLVGYAGGSLATGYAAIGAGAVLGLASVPALPLLAATVLVGGTAAYFGSQFGRNAFKNAYRSLNGG